MQISLYNKEGLLQKTYTKKDFETFAAFDGISLITDDKVMTLKTPMVGYPCTLDIQYDIKNTGYIELPDWSLSSNSSTELFRYTVIVPSDLDIRYKSKNLKIQPTFKDSGGLKTYVWQLANQLSRRIETNGYQKSRYVSSIQIAPNRFEYDGYAGSFKNWNRFGAWCYSLYEETPALPKRRIDELLALVAGFQTQEEKINALYDYLKSNMRYVSIQLGIGGFKPFSAAFVDQKKYGDCKALTNYMRTILKIAGIRSYPALINSGYDNPPIDPDFPSSPFNHVILCIPLQKDTVWLECTSNTAQTGYLGSFTENKIALLLTEEGGKLIRTPASNYLSNQIITKTTIILNEEGSASVQQKISSTGSFRDFFMYVNVAAEHKQSEYLRRQMSYKLSDKFSLSKEVEDSLQFYNTIVSVYYNKFYDFKSGNKLFIQPRFFKLFDEDLKQSKRTIEYVFEDPFLKTDITQVTIPEGFKWESLPQDKKIDINDFYYAREISKLSDNTIEIKTSIHLKKNIIPADEYETAAVFFNEVNKEEAKKFILLKQ